MRTCWAAAPRKTPRSRVPCSRASPARAARWSAFNAGAALMVAGRAATLEEGVRLAEQTLDSGAALQSMESFVSKTRELAPEEVGDRAR